MNKDEKQVAHQSARAIIMEKKRSDVCIDSPVSILGDLCGTVETSFQLVGRPEIITPHGSPRIQTK